MNSFSLSCVFRRALNSYSRAIDHHFSNFATLYFDIGSEYNLSLPLGEIHREECAYALQTRGAAGRIDTRSSLIRNIFLVYERIRREYLDYYRALNV